MPNIGRKNASKHSKSMHSQSQIQLEDIKTKTPPSTTEDDTSQISVPEHHMFPDIPTTQGELFFECLFFLYSILALTLQLVNIYKSLWWLPNYSSSGMLKIHLMHPYLISCLGLILGRRVTWCFVQKISLCIQLTFWPCASSETKTMLTILEWLIKIPLLCGVLTSFMYSGIQVILTFPLSSLLFLFYPILLYGLLFYRELLEVASEKRIMAVVLRFSTLMQQLSYSVDSNAAHACSIVPQQIRHEVDILSQDFYLKIRMCIYCSFCASYYAIFAPVCFAKPYLYIDYWWVCELCVVVFLSSFALQLLFLLPLKRCDLLHRSAAHLGAWHRMEVKLSHAMQLPYPTWSEAYLGYEGAVVKHGRCLFRGQGECVAATPGNYSYTRFYLLFHDPFRVINWLCWLDVILIFLQFFMLVHSREWQHIITLVALMFANYVMLFKLLKDKVILSRIHNPSPEDKEIINMKS